MNVLKRVYYCAKNENIPIYHVTTNDLKLFTTTEKDMKRGDSRFPPESNRTNIEDLF